MSRWLAQKIFIDTLFKVLQQTAMGNFLESSESNHGILGEFYEKHLTLLQ